MNDKKSLLSFREVAALTGRSRTSIYADIKAGRFPRPIKTGLRSSRWLAEEVEDWIDQRKAERDSQGGN
ncbi:MAG: AlpA family transcriptional regulator [Burkholderiales bacterium]|jgi:prophage regulatory protein